MGVIGTVAGGAVDFVTYPISYGVKAFTGKTIGDYVGGVQRPPSTTGFWSGGASFATDLAVPVALTMLVPPVGAASMLAVIGTKAVTGNSIGDYVVGDTNAKRQAAEDTRVDQEYQMAQQRMQSRGMSPSSPQQNVEVPNIGAQQSRGHDQAHTR